MGAAAERWYEEIRTDEPDSRAARRLATVPCERPMRGRPEVVDKAGEGGSGDSGETRWNVLAEELVSYPTPAQRIWIEPAREAGRSASRAGRPDQGGGVSRAYADAWLERELERLRLRRAVALSDSPTAAGNRHGAPATAGLSAGVDDRLRIGDPATVARSFADGTIRTTGIDRRTRASRPDRSTSHRRARAGETVATSSRTRVAHLGPRGLRRLLPGAATLAVLVGSWFAVGALAASAHESQLQRLPGSVTVPGGYVYVAQPGDTLWSIAARSEPTADPRPLVDRLQAELKGRTLQPGDRLFLPRTSG